MNKKKLLSAILAALLAFSVLAGCGSASSGEEDTAAEAGTVEETTDSGITTDVVNIAIQPSAAFIPLYIARENGWIEEALAEYGVTVNWNDFESGPPMNESMASGDSDIGVIGDVPTVSAIAAGQNNEVVAITCMAPDSYALLVAADSELSSVEDLAGKKIATVVGSTGHNLVDKLLDTVGLDINSDIELVNISAGDAATVLATGEVDAVAIWEPTITRITNDGTAKILATGSDCGLSGVNTMVARAEFAQANPKIIEVIVEQFARGVAALADLDDETLAAVAEDLSLEPDQINLIVPKFDYRVSIQQDSIDALQDTIKFLVGIETLDEEYDIAPYVNSSYTESADLAQYLG